MDTIWYIHIKEYYSAIKRTDVPIYTWCNMDEPQKHRSKGNKADAKGHIIYDSTYMKQNMHMYIERIQTSVLPRAGEMGLTANGGGVSFCVNGNVLDYVSANGYITL